MNDIQIFKNEQFGQVRVITKDGEPWFVGKDVAEILGYKDTADAIRNHVEDDEKYLSKVGEIPTLKTSNYGAYLINESGLYSLAFGSKLPTAKKFKKWVTSDVLPSIRKHGMYATDELINNPDLLIAAATKIKEERQARLEAEKQRDKLIHQNKLYTTSEIAKELGLKSANKLNQLLAEKKVQYKQNKTWLLYSKYADCGYVSIKQDILDNGHIIYDRKWSGKGRDFILNLFKE
jgi:prophage antirepressor-like protein